MPRTIFAAAGKAAATGADGIAVVGRRSSNQNRLPSPCTLSTCSSPPMRRTCAIAMAMPSPVPPYLRTLPASTWKNGSKILARYSGGMPMPVSSTLKWSR